MAEKEKPGPTRPVVPESKKPDRLAEPLDTEQAPRLPFAVVGIGASAGGLETFTEFFDAMRPDSGMSFVLIQHLPPARESMMADILSKHTKMPVRQVEDGMPVEPDNVYVIRPGHTMTIRDGALHLGEPLEKPGHRRPVDDFFRSLAEEQRERAIGVVMSGMGSNGSAGAESIKVVGGICIAQDLESAKFPSMPRSLIDNGLADFILSPHEMPEVLIRYVKHPYAAGARSPEAALRQDGPSLNDVLAILRARTRRDFSGYKKPTLIRRIQRRMGMHQVTKMEEYARSLRHNSSEVMALADDLMIHVTGFFRDPEAWETLRERVLMPLTAERENEATIRGWVTACSSGEEAYTLAMLLTEAADAAGKHFDIKIFATDTAERSLGYARSGTYPMGIEAEISGERLERFFDKEESTYRVKRELRELVVFAPQNVLQDPPFSRLDVCTCRNLLIYLEPELQQRVLSLIHFGLRDGGALFLGTSETVTGAEELFEPIDKKSRIFRRIGPTRHGAIEFPRLHRATGEVEPIEARPLPRASLAQITNKILLSQYTPAAVVVDRQNRIMFFHGNTEQYLVQPRGEPTRDLMSLAIESVRGALRTALHRATSEHESATAKDGVIETPSGRRRIEVTVAPLEEHAPSPYFLVVFRELPEPSPLVPSRDQGPEDRRQLEEELQRARDELQSTIEELQNSNEEMKASNEEVTSINEELQSTNEELETSKEELQSLNEELSTVNSQLQAKMEEHEATSNDLSSLLSSTDIAVIFLDTRLRIRRFTPAVKDLLELIPSDVGRPLSDLARKFSDPQLVAHVRAVLEKLVPIEKEISSESGRWYVRRVLPYRTTDNRIDGVVITFVDITERKHALNALTQAEERLRLAAEAGGIADWELELPSRRLHGPATLRQLLGVGPEVKEEADFLSSLIHPDDRAIRDRAIESAIDPASDGTYRIEFRIIRPNGQIAWMESRGRATFADTDKGRVAKSVRGTMMDVSKRKLAEEAMKEAKRVAEAANDAKDQFLANVSHELRTPLAAILLWIKLFEDSRQPQPAQFAEGVDAIHRSAESLHELVEDLLDVSRIAAGKVRLDFESIDLAAVTRTAIETIRPAAEGKGVRIDADLPSHDGAVSADPNRIQQVIWNLLSNAVKFTGTGGRVSVALQQNDHHVVLRVSDTGQGIKPDFLPRIFDRFGQGDSTNPGPGLGLGLAISKQLIEWHGGTITAQSAGVGKGATFIVRLPVSKIARPASARAPHAKSEAATSSNLAGTRVLLVEDDADTRKGLTALLTARRGKVTAVDSAKAALEAFKKQPPQIILCDIGLPEMDGNALLRQIRTYEATQKAALVPAIALTAYATEKDRRKTVQSGFQHFMSKPADAQELVNVICELVQQAD